MFEKCIKCNRIGESCVPNLMLLPFSELLQWWDKRQKHLGWTNKILEEKSKVPLGTINRIKGGDYMDCKYSTIRSVLIALIGGTTDEFPCTDLVEKELKQMDQLEKQAAMLSVVEAENELLKARLKDVDKLLQGIDERHRQDIRIIKQEFQEQKQEYKDTIAFLREELKERRSLHQNK
jgi:predicted transcriptional regulator